LHKTTTTVTAMYQQGAKES